MMKAKGHDNSESRAHSLTALLSRAAPWIAMAYVVGVACFLLRLLAALWGGRQLQTATAQLTQPKLLKLIADQANRMRLKIVPVVAYCERVAVPTVVSVLRPMILLPASLMTELSPNDFAAIIGHELAHIRRYDLWMNLLQRVIESLLFFHPVVWFISRQVSTEREVCCDELVVSSGCEPMNYAGALLRMAELCAMSRRPGALSLAVTGDKAPLLERRIERLMNWDRSPRLNLTRAGMVGLLMILVSLIVVPGIAHTLAMAQGAGGDSQSNDQSQPALGLRATSGLKQEKSDSNSINISGIVFGPDGTPFKGAKLFVHSNSLAKKGPIPKDTTAKVYEAGNENGMQVLKVVNPEMRAVMKRFGLDPNKVDAATAQALEENAELKAALQPIMEKLFEPNPDHFPKSLAVSGTDGSFRFTVPKAWFEVPYNKDLDVIAVAPGFGPGWTMDKTSDDFTGLKLRLVKDIPIKGRIVEQDGRPVKNAKVTMGSIFDRPDSTIDTWRETVVAAATGNTERYNELLIRSVSQFPGWHLNAIPRVLTTNDDGRFEVSGVGGERVVFGIEVTGSGFGKDEFSVMTRPGEGISVPAGRQLPQANLRTYGATFTHIVKSTRPVEGTVRDKSTGKPLVGIQVAAFGPAYVDTFTDKNGHYTLTGLPKSETYEVTAWPWGGRETSQRYPNTTKHVEADDNKQTVTVDFDLVPGVVFRGKVTDAATGAPVAGANVRYGASHDNSHLATFAFYGNPAFPKGSNTLNAPQLLQTHTNTGADGSFSLVGVPGHGVIAVNVSDGPYPLVVLEGTNGLKRLVETAVPSVNNFAIHAIERVDASPGIESVDVEFKLRSSKPLVGKIVDPNGKPAVGVSVLGLNADNFNSMEPLASSEFAVTGLTTANPRLLVFHHAERRLGAAVVVSDGTVGPLTIELKRCGSLEGRLLDERRRPNAAQVIYAQIVEDAKEPDVVPKLSATTDQDGHFRMEGLIPTKTYNLSLQSNYLQNVPALIPFSPKEITVAPGEAKDLGDIVRVPKAYLGVGFSTETACIVKFAVPDSPAAHQGLQSKDTIVKVDQKQVKIPNDVRDIISKKKPGDKVQLEVRRGEQALQLEVTLRQDPSQ